MDLSIEVILNCATREEGLALAEILGSWSCKPDALVRTLQRRSLNIFQWLNNATRTYEEILIQVAGKHGIRRVLFETDEDLERRLIRSVSNKALSEMNHEQRQTYVQAMIPHAVGAGGIVLAQASGFGIYQMSSTVVGALTAAAGLKLPFLLYMGMSKAISIAIGPIGWAGLGVGILHTLTKPDYNQLVAAIASVGAMRRRLSSEWEWRGYSGTEILRKSLKVLFLVIATALLIWATRGMLT
jgi:uncharacterized protein YaaW (UPF0174 family)